MATKKFEKDSNEWKLFADYWELCPKVVENLQDFRNKYHGQFIEDLILALVSAKDATKDNIRPVFVDYWNLCQSLWEIEDTDGYWERVVKMTDDFYKKHKNDFAKKLALSLTEMLERKHRAKTKGEKP